MSKHVGMNNYIQCARTPNHGEP